MNKQLFSNYAAKKIQMKALEEELELMKPEILKEMGDNEEVEIEGGVFTITKKRNWTYPEEIKKQDEALKAKKKEAEQLGTAEYTETIYPTFKAK